MDLYLRIAPELHLKRLLVGGIEKVYELNRCFRNEGVSTRHNPEFTMLEVYEAYSDYEGMMRLTEDMFCAVAQEVLGTPKISYQGTEIDFTPSWQRRSFRQMVGERFGIVPEDNPGEMLAKLRRHGLAKDTAKLSRSQINSIIEDMLEKDMQPCPTFVTDYFSSFCPLAKGSAENPRVAERFELYVAGMEIANAYSELNDPLEQRARLEKEIRDAEPGDTKCVDDDFLTALEHGMPPAGGLGVGIDRLTMLFLDQPSIRDVILFPLLRPQDEAAESGGDLSS
jgi:lysyl-tRNA synthetase class 2